MSDHRAERLDDPGSGPHDGIHAAPALSLPATADDILASISDGVIAVDNEWRIVYFNPATQRMWGRRLDGAIGKRIHEVLDVGPDNPFNAAYTGSKQSGQNLVLTAYSEMFGAWLDVRGYPHPGGYTILFSVSKDRPTVSTLYTDRNREATRSINQRLFETSIDLIIVVDRQGNLLRVSPSARVTLGHRPEEMAGRNATDFIHPDDLEHTREEMRMARRGRLTRNFDCRYRHKDGGWVPISWTGVWSEREEQHIFIGRDITERITLETQLRHAQKMEAIGRLTGGVAHDFNNILTVVIGMNEILADALRDNRQLAEIAATIDEAATRGAQLTQRMLAFARKQPLNARNLDLNDVVGRMATILHRTLGEDIAIKTAFATDLWQAVADPSQIEDAILNLAVNARDAMPKGGQLVIETANVHLDENYAAHNIEVAPGDYVALTVTDSGTGMPLEVVERVFEPFFTTKEVGHGTGLGLSMVYGFIKQSRGHVKVYSELGHGTSIKLYLPRAESAGSTENAAARATVGPAHAIGRETVLVVEDSGAVRKVAVNILKSLGYKVLEAEDGVAALKVIEQPVEIDLLFTDLIMPNGIDGQELLVRARTLRPNLKALFTSGYSEHFLKGRGDTDESVPLLGKPYRTHKLAEAVRAALDGAPA